MSEFVSLLFRAAERTASPHDGHIPFRDHVQSLDDQVIDQLGELPDGAVLTELSQKLECCEQIVLRTLENLRHKNVVVCLNRERKHYALCEFVRTGITESWRLRNESKREKEIARLAYQTGTMEHRIYSVLRNNNGIASVAIVARELGESVKTIDKAVQRYILYKQGVPNKFEYTIGSLIDRVFSVLNDHHGVASVDFISRVLGKSVQEIDAAVQCLIDQRDSRGANANLCPVTLDVELSHSGLNTQILDVLKRTGGASLGEICGALDVSRSKIERVVEKLQLDNLINVDQGFIRVRESAWAG